MKIDFLIIEMLLLVCRDEDRFVDFIVIGVMCVGMMMLQDILEKYFQILMVWVKEIDYFIVEKNYVCGFDWYCGQFDIMWVLCGEVSLNYVKVCDFFGVFQWIFCDCFDVWLIYVLCDLVKWVVL